MNLRSLACNTVISLTGSFGPVLLDVNNARKASRYVPLVACEVVMLPELIMCRWKFRRHRHRDTGTTESTWRLRPRAVLASSSRVRLDTPGVSWLDGLRRGQRWDSALEFVRIAGGGSTSGVLRCVRPSFHGDDSLLTLPSCAEFPGASSPSLQKMTLLVISVCRLDSSARSGIFSSIANTSYCCFRGSLSITIRLPRTRAYSASSCAERHVSLRFSSFEAQRLDAQERGDYNDYKR